MLAITGRSVPRTNYPRRFLTALTKNFMNARMDLSVKRMEVIAIWILSTELTD